MGEMTDYLRRQEEQRYFGGCCEHTAQVFSFCAAFLGMVCYALERVEYFGGFFCFVIYVVREMRSPNLFSFFLGNKLSLQCIQILDILLPSPPSSPRLTRLQHARPSCFIVKHVSSRNEPAPSLHQILLVAVQDFRKAEVGSIEL